MDDRRFDNWARKVAGLGSRRRVLGGLVGVGGAALLGAFRRNAFDVAAHHGQSGPGDPCRDDRQCVGADAPLVCAWNGFDYDGDLNCCTFEGNRCGFDEACCGLASCIGGFCSSAGSASASAGSGGVATSSADAGTVFVGDINSGGNVGNTIGIGNTQGGVRVNGDNVSNVTDVSVSADGGMAIADASGGSGNIAGGSGGYYNQSGQYVDPRCSNYPLGPGCGCWQGPYDDNPCDGSMICCRQGSDSSGVCLEIQGCTGWYGPGEACPGYCGWGSGCPSCTTGYCNWFGYCDWSQ
ncbi:MAG: hypothetical protein KY456_09295 [Chloroflexi bacterium]|nr:hypothetical protein [Chloroflexota bacterium]